ncbi:hypothetical protein BT69DRAFT_632198 [Atractiella rhizophila]|nr:hypothetical protein BT69DRAFT_632198 [Atractiella rhizophila]
MLPESNVATSPFLCQIPILELAHCTVAVLLLTAQSLTNRREDTDTKWRGHVHIFTSIKRSTTKLLLFSSLLSHCSHAREVNNPLHTDLTTSHANGAFRPTYTSQPTTFATRTDRRETHRYAAKRQSIGTLE